MVMIHPYQMLPSFYTIYMKKERHKMKKLYHFIHKNLWIS